MFLRFCLTLVLLLSMHLCLASNPDSDLTKPSAAAQQMIATLRLQEHNTASREHPRWQKPNHIVVVVPPEFAAMSTPLVTALQQIAGDIPLSTYQPSAQEKPPAYLQQADVVFGWCNQQLLSLLPKLVWIQQFSAGAEKCTSTTGITQQDFILTNAQHMASPVIAEHAIAMMLSLTRQLPLYQRQQMQQTWQRPTQLTSTDINQKTLLVLGLGGIGTEVAKRAHGLGMRVIATRNSSRKGPEYVDYVGLADEMLKLAEQADVVINALPYTRATENVINAEFLAALKPGSYYISVGRGKTTDLTALTKALTSHQLAGVGLDVTEPEPLPSDHPLWQMDNVIITPHVAGFSKSAIQRNFLLYQENLRRYLQGDKLLNIVDLKRGY
ncbi:D-2-hydroxyacid dehydrogenase [Oceanicoccus sp. KOV_DT_Chl]|uniref:D-2-hydroxyacid dehydrogenase n=1 Tax=Oceanicoccus sp. KOV_DT_Chl TaxID=1904639 RepID=UPI000C7CAB4F|nr:D-2-hydroxyacid dehydrogenase [Oceanicoccus sp. KOV_DT_Chl]